MATENQPTTRVAVLGTGIMGGPMARHLAAAGYHVTAWDSDVARRDALREHGVTPCETAREATREAQLVVTMLPDAEVTAAVCGEALSRVNRTWVQSATVGVAGTEELGELARALDVELIDCPLLGTRSTAEAGLLSALASGPAAAEPEVRVVLQAFCKRVLWLGEAGRGTKLKLVMNNWVVGLVALVAETMALAEALEFSGEDFLDLIAGGPLDVEQAQIKGRMMHLRQFEPALPLRHAAKDARLIATIAREIGLDLPVGAAVAQAYARACDAQLGDQDLAALFRVLARDDAATEAGDDAG